MTHQYRLPEGMRYATLEERKKFYEKEFNWQGAKEWVSHHKNVVFAVIIGQHTKIYPKEFEKFKDNILRIDKYEELDDVYNDIKKFLPEGAYYDRNVYNDREKCKACKKPRYDCWDCENFGGQELAFDIDPENIICPEHGGLAQKMKEHQGLGFCIYEFNEAKKSAQKLYDTIKERFSNIKMVYSGRGLHLHVMDKDAYTLTKDERSKIADDIWNKGIKHDRWVARGGSRLIRLPYSLHGMVSRIVTPLELSDLEKFDPRTDERIMPGFVSAARQEQR